MSRATPPARASRAPGLSAWQRRVTSAVIEALLADEDDRGALIPGGAEACARAYAGSTTRSVGAAPDLRRGFVLLSLLMEWLPLFVIGAPAA